MQQQPLNAPLPSQPSYSSSTVPQAVLQPPRGRMPKWRALNALATLLKAVAWLIVLLSALTAVLLIAAGIFGNPIPIPNLGLGSSILNSIVLAIACLLGGGLAFLIFFAYAELILLLISLERNTRNRW